MYNKTFKTMDKYPLVFLIAIPTVIIKVLFDIFTVPSLKYAMESIKLGRNITSLFSNEIIQFAVINIIGVGILFLLIYPSVLNYIYCASNNEIQKKWYKYGIKKFALRMLHLYILSIITFGLIILVMFNFISSFYSSFSSILMLPIGIIAFVIFANIQIGTVSIVVEKSIKESIKAYFHFFIDIIFPLYGTVIIFRLPEKLLNEALKVGFIESSNLLCNISSLSGDYSTVKIVLSFAIYAIIIIANIYATTFIYTYLTHTYIAERQEYINNRKNESESDLITSNP